MFPQKVRRLSSTPNNELKIVVSAMSTSPARSPLGGIQRNMLNSVLPASVNGCGLDLTKGCLPRTKKAVGSSDVTAQCGEGMVKLGGGTPFVLALLFKTPAKRKG